MGNVLDDCCVQLLIVMDGERNYSMGVRWTGLPHSPKTDSDRLMKDNCLTTDCLPLDNRYRSLDCGGVPSIGLPML